MIDRLQSEQAVLAALLEHPGRWWMELQDLSPSWFKDPVHRQIASAIVRLRDRGRRIHWTRVRATLGWQERSVRWRVRRGYRNVQRGLLESLAKALGTDFNTAALVSAIRSPAKSWQETERES